MNYTKKSEKKVQKNDNHTVKHKPKQLSITEDDINDFCDKILEISNPDESSKKYTYYSDNGKFVDLRTDMFRCLNMTQYIKSYDEKCLPDFSREDFKIEISSKSSISVAKKINKEKSGYICIVNFASPKHPGGGFINGKNSQETNNCCQSMLFESLKLKSNSEFYEEWGTFNFTFQMRDHSHKSQYSHNSIFSKQSTPQKKQIQNSNKPQLISSNKLQLPPTYNSSYNLPQVHHFLPSSNTSKKQLNTQIALSNIPSQKATQILNPHSSISSSNSSTLPQPKRKRNISKIIDSFSYKNGLIYSPNVPVMAEITAESSKSSRPTLHMFDNSEVFLVDFISISPVDKFHIMESLKNSDDKEYDDDGDDDNVNDIINEVMKEKIRNVLTFAAGKEDYLILGAFGCGYFGNDSKDVINLFIEVLFKEKFAYYFKRIDFAMGIMDNTYDVFKSALRKYVKSDSEPIRKRKDDDDYDYD